MYAAVCTFLGQQAVKLTLDFEGVDIDGFMPFFFSMTNAASWVVDCKER